MARQTKPRKFCIFCVMQPLLGVFSRPCGLYPIVATKLVDNEVHHHHSRAIYVVLKEDEYQKLDIVGMRSVRMVKRNETVSAN